VQLNVHEEFAGNVDQFLASPDVVKSVAKGDQEVEAAKEKYKREEAKAEGEYQRSLAEAKRAKKEAAERAERAEDAGERREAWVLQRHVDGDYQAKFVV
jgi:hypothetical protein